VKSLETLLKLAQRRMDDLGVEAARCVMGVEASRVRHAALRGQAEIEARLAADDPGLAPLMPAYLERVKTQAAALLKAIASDEANLQALRAQIALAYQEKSKLAELLEQQSARDSKRRLDLEQALLDEAAIVGASRYRA